MRRIILLVMGSILLSGGLLFAQEAAAEDTIKPWTYGDYVAINLNQVSFVNWAAGGENSFSATVLGKFFANYKKDIFISENFLNASYGVIRSEEFGFRKNEDNIEFESKFGYEINKKGNLFHSSLANFKSQFADGFDYPNDSTVISKFLAPGYLTVSTGVEYKPAEYFSLYVSPVTGKFTFVTTQAIANTGRYGNDAAVVDENGNIIKKGKKTRSEFGASLTAKFQKDIIKNVNLNTKLDLFNNFTDPNKDNRKYVDVNWETTITLKVNDYLAASILLHLIYDHDIDIPDEDDPTKTKKGVQFKEVFGVQFSYKFKNKS